MPFNGSGTFSIINQFVPNTTILSSAVNQNFSDIATGLSDCLTRDGQAGMTAALKAIAGSAAAPSISFTADATTGLYLISSGNLGLTANGALALTLNSAQVAAFSQSAYAKTFVILNTAAASTSSNIASIGTASTGAISIGTSTSWATNGYLLADSEIMSYTVASAAGLTINTRGDMGTTGAAHATGATITSLYSGLGYRDLLLPARATASRPTAPARGDFGYNTGSAQPEFYNGTTWSSISQPQLVPQGYLTPDSTTPIVGSDASSATSILYVPFTGNLLPVPTNGVFTTIAFSTAGAALSASQSASNIYDVFAFVSGGVLDFGIGPSWSAGSGGSVTPGSCARGTGAGGASITRTNGVYVNTTTMTLLNGVASSSIATASGLYLGSVFINPATAGTYNLHRSYGQTRQWGLWNAFNRVPVYLKAGDGTASWAYATATYRAANNATANNLTIFSGLAEDVYYLSNVGAASNTNGSNVNVQVGIGINTTGTASGYNPPLGGVVTGAGQTIELAAAYQSAPLLGINTVTALEKGNTAFTFFGTETNMILSAQWRA